MCKHLVVSVTDHDRAGMITGFDLKLDTWLGKEDVVEKPRAIKKKKKKAKRSGSALRESVDSLNSTNRSSMNRSDSKGKETRSNSTRGNERIVNG